MGKKSSDDSNVLYQITAEDDVKYVWIKMITIGTYNRLKETKESRESKH